MDTILGTVQAFAFTFTPKDWLPCDGRLLKVSEHSSLFSLIGTLYGGDGHNTFALPDLRNRIVKGANGDVGQWENVASSEGVKTVKLNYCICVNGVFPSRLY